MNHLEKAKADLEEAIKAEGNSRDTMAESFRRTAHLYALISIAESLETLASTVTPNIVEGYAGSINIDNGRG